MGHGIIIPGEEYQMKVSLEALIKIAEYLMENGKKMKPGDKFTITGTDRKKLTMFLE